jgi:hypothetical protein
MLVFHASEKDCVVEDGEGAQECVICFEEFAVGDEMGRMECLCKFHRVSLRLELLLEPMKGMLTRCCRHVYGNGGIRKVQVLVPCTRRVLDLACYCMDLCNAYWVGQR